MPPVEPAPAPALPDAQMADFLRDNMVRYENGRRLKTEIEEDAERRLAPVKAEISVAESNLVRYAEQHSIERLPQFTGLPTFSIKTETNVKNVDPAKVTDWALAQGLKATLGIHHQKLGALIRERIEEGGELPPDGSIEVSTFKRLVRRA